MLSEDALSQLGITDPKLNMEIPLSYYDKNGQQEKTFTLSGWFHSYTGTGMGFVSEAYCKNAGYTMAQDGVLSLSLNKMPDDFHRIQKDVELNENQSFSGAVSMKSSSGSVIAMVVLLVFFIIGSGYLLIYNVLYISISKDTRFYGLMKTLGTTQVQIKSLVKNQALKFACIGIPIGIVLATAVSFGIVPFVLNEGFEQGKSIMDAEMFFHPSIYILSVIFSAITVWIACNAPAKAAAKISPVEALKFQNFAPKKTKSRNSTNGGKLHIMAFHNVFRDKKRAILVFMSLFMGITMILGVNGVIGSMNAENFIKEYMNYHFEYNDIQFEQPEQPNKEVPQFDEHFVEQIQQVNGIENVDVQKTVWAGIDFDENALEGFMKIQYEDSRYKSKGQSYEYANDTDRLCITMALCGAPGAAVALEELYAMGCETFIVCGGAGALTNDSKVGEIIVPVSAVRDEGTSYHYLAPSREIECHKETVEKVVSYLKEMEVPFKTGKTWTSDAIYRETPDMIERRRSEGCITVEMEAAAFFAVSHYYHIPLAQLLYAGDDVSGEEWDSRNWNNQKNIRYELLRIAIEIVKKL